MQRRRELALQASVVNAIRREGGYARKWASGYNVGVPDLVTVPYHMAPVFLEVKHEIGLPDQFRRKVDLRANQRTELQKLAAVGARVFVAVFCQLRSGGMHLVLLPPPQKGDDLYVSSDMLSEATRFIVGKKLNVTERLKAAVESPQ